MLNRSFIAMAITDTSLSGYSHSFCRERTDVCRCLSHIMEHRKNDSRLHATRSLHNLTASYNTNSMKHSPPPSLDSTINISTSTTDASIALDKTTDKTWRLKIHDGLNKDGSRHFVMHKGTWTTDHHLVNVETSGNSACERR